MFVLNFQLSVSSCLRSCKLSWKYCNKYLSVLQFCKHVPHSGWYWQVNLKLFFSLMVTHCWWIGEHVVNLQSPLQVPKNESYLIDSCWFPTPIINIHKPWFPKEMPNLPWSIIENPSGYPWHLHGDYEMEQIQHSKQLLCGGFQDTFGNLAITNSMLFFLGG